MTRRLTWEITERSVDSRDPRNNTSDHTLYDDGKDTGYGICKYGLDRWEWYKGDVEDYARHDHWCSARKECEVLYRMSSSCAGRESSP